MPNFIIQYRQARDWDSRKRVTKVLAYDDPCNANGWYQLHRKHYDGLELEVMRIKQVFDIKMYDWRILDSCTGQMLWESRACF